MRALYHVYHSLAATPLEYNGAFIGFVRDRADTRLPIPIKMPPSASLEWKKVQAVDNPSEVYKAYKSIPQGVLWTPLTAAAKKSFNIPRMLVLPTVEFLIFSALESKVCHMNFGRLLTTTS